MRKSREGNAGRNLFGDHAAWGWLEQTLRSHLQAFDGFVWEKLIAIPLARRLISESTYW